MFSFLVANYFATRKGNLVLLTMCGGLFQIAAFIAEPVMGAGGVILPPATYFEKVNYLFVFTFYLSKRVVTRTGK